MTALTQSLTAALNIGDKYQYGPYEAIITEIYDALSVEIRLPGGRKVIRADELESKILDKTQKLLGADTYRLLLDFIPSSQLRCIEELLSTNEGAFFQNKLAEIESVINTMPAIYGQDGLGDDAIAHLHYFSGGCDWYITEKDVDDPFGDSPSITEQHQAHGFAKFASESQNSEIGYISIEQLLSQRTVELDLHWNPVTIGSLKNNPS